MGVDQRDARTRSPTAASTSTRRGPSSRRSRWSEEGAAIVDVGGESTRPALYGAAEELSIDEEMRPRRPGRSRGSARARTLPFRSTPARPPSRGRPRGPARTSSTTSPPDGSTPDLARRGRGARSWRYPHAHEGHRSPDACRTTCATTTPWRTWPRFWPRPPTARSPPGVSPQALALDPGLGFGKTLEGNLTLLRHLAALRSLGFPLCVGASRKAFVRRFSGVAEDAPARGPPPRLAGRAGRGGRRRGVDRPRARRAESVRFLDMLQCDRPRPLGGPRAGQRRRPGDPGPRLPVRRPRPT